MKKLLVLLLVLGLILVPIAACTNDAGKPETSPKVSDGTQSEQRALGGELIFPIANFDTFFNPYVQGTMIEFAWPCYEPLAYLKADGKWYPTLAESWTRNDEDFSLTIKLKDGILFHNGDKFDANDVAFTVQSRLDFGTGSVIGGPISVEVLDSSTVKVNWDYFSLDYEKWILTQYMFSKETFDEKGLDWILTNMVGTGPYVMKEYIPDVHIKYDRNDDYREPLTSGPDTITIRSIPEETTRVAAFLNGEISCMSSGNPVNVAQIEGAGFVGNPNYNTNNIIQQHAAVLTLDPNAPLSNVKVRQAIYNHGIDWDNVAEIVYGSLGYHTAAIGSDRMGYYKDGLEQNTYDPEKAKTMLAEAGYPDGFKTTIYAISGFTQDAATVVQADLKEIGIEAEVKVDEMSLIFTDYINGKVSDTGIVLLGRTFDSSFQMDRFNKFHSPGGTCNGHQVWSDELVSMWEKTKASRTEEEMNQNLYEYVNQYVNVESTFWPAANCNYQMFYQDNVHFGEMAPAVSCGYDATEIWIDAK